MKPNEQYESGFDHIDHPGYKGDVRQRAIHVPGPGRGGVEGSQGVSGQRKAGTTPQRETFLWGLQNPGGGPIPDEGQ